MNKIKAIVIDDEAFARSLISQMIPELNPAFEITGEADNINHARDLIHELKPDVVFLDIHMPTGSGFALLSMFDEINFEVVFISGFDYYALKAFEFNALDYILKPIDDEKFTRTLKKVRLRIEEKNRPDRDFKTILQSYDPEKLTISKIPIHTGNKVILLNIEDLIYIKADDGHTIFKTNSGQKHFSSRQLSALEFILKDYPYMIKVNKGTFVNVNHISSYSKGINCFLCMTDNTEIEIPRRKKGEILEFLSGKKKNAGD